MIYDLEKMRELDRYAIILSCSNSYLYYHESSYYQPVYDKIINHTRGKWEKAVKWFVSNSARCLRLGGEGFIVSFDPGTYSRNKMQIGFRGVNEFLRWAEEKAYIHIYRGYVDEWEVRDGKRVAKKTVASRITLRQRALDLWSGVEIPNLEKELDYKSCVVLRDRKTKEAIEIEDTYLEKDRKFMTTYNDSLHENTITFRGKNICVPQYTRTYTGSLDITGRLYVQGGGVQLMPQDIRKDHLKIDGEPVVELDYSAMHPMLCLQLLSNTMPVSDILGLGFDPYGADLSFVAVDGKKKRAMERKIRKSYKPLRNLAKLAILIAMNSPDYPNAMSALTNKINEDRKRPEKQQKFYGIDGVVPVGKVFEALQNHNDLIREVFFSDKGVVLQKYDSDIMMRVIEIVLQTGNSILCYHDSALVKESAKEILRDAMRVAWKEILRDDTFCRIEEK